MADLIQTIERDIRRRADELKPAFDEYQLLQRAQHALEATNGQVAVTRRPGRTASHATRPARKTQKASPRSKVTKASVRAGRGERTKTILALLENNPEITAANIALLLDITPNNAQATIYRLRKQGRVDRRRGRWVVKPA